MRLQPTRVSALDNARVLDVACGDRHTVFMTSHKPLKLKDDPLFKEHFELLKVSLTLFCNAYYYGSHLI